MASKREAVTVCGLDQHVVAAEEEETKEIRAGDVEISIVNQQPAMFKSLEITLNIF